MGSAEMQGALWSVGAKEWAELAESQHVVLYERTFEELGVGQGVRLLEAGCGAGLALSLAAERGAEVTGLDASAGLLEIAAGRLPEASLHQGDLEELPFGEDTFDAVSAFNSVQFAASPERALGELARVARPGAGIAVVVWGPPAECDFCQVFAALGSFLPAPVPNAPGPLALSRPGRLEEAFAGAGLDVERTVSIPTPFIYRNLDEAVRMPMSTGPGQRALEAGGAEAVRERLTETLSAFERPDGSVHLDNVFVVAITRA